MFNILIISLFSIFLIQYVVADVNISLLKGDNEYIENSTPADDIQYARM